MSRERCGWARGAEYERYHDEEWGIPKRGERELFELLNLEGAQAGLSWITILRKREGYRRAFAAWDPAVIAAFGEADVARLLADGDIVRNRLKVSAAIANARALLALHAAGGTLSGVLWASVGGVPQVNHPSSVADVPASTPVSAALATELKRLGFRFVGPTIVYALMQSAGLVDDHVATCFRRAGDP
ncbi:MAG: DNA-3-methyladenine glycosylase [uncultured Solirubrobacteraceae bacterium]|uniref:DNA-3-methyladenine glycosylase n=1 Tax=uncultured Solirubrobacteraceae bacterium TaxID=1162706 RepID=A0A6J4RW13_9ACTN|nr:MAG: DNA-3-methyladenine glycosylase [uncultured Solirubrobacteraceae bacterium]